nr:Chain E, GLY-ALA-LYS-LYX-ASP-GLN-TYR-PHE-LEU5N22_G Chain G, GLY-ALA-LYS-LYX-ASP-GLN-TYR-PHE-LEU5N22_J Chain J, GLY-ALA-LYS-LYX-ASP-GLN-TYR-PHE-LEU5N22_L Chain L, GLY-ALA-LYS-LYX-ASP-GLN-TYR-PHE-LEU
RRVIGAKKDQYFL